MQIDVTYIMITKKDVQKYLRKDTDVAVLWNQSLKHLLVIL